MENKQECGKEGESMALEYLRERGLRLVAARYRTPYGEIDLIMEDGKTLVFVEVKRRLSTVLCDPEEVITRAKRRHLVRSALTFIQERKFEDRLIRFDVVAIRDGIKHYPDAFLVEDEYYY